VARNDQIVRLLTVARALAGSRRGIPLKTLAERHGWSLRSLYRDIEALERAGFPVMSEDSRYRLMEGWDSPALPGLEQDEILALYTLRALAETWRVSSVGRALDRLWMKLTAGSERQSRLFPAVREPWFRVRAPFAIDYRPHERTIATFETAIREQIAVDCRYRAVSTQEVTARTVEAGELYWDPRLESLYVIGWCRLRHDVRVFAVHRFMTAALTGERFSPRPEARSRAALRDSFRLWRARRVETVRIRFSAGAADEIRERRWSAGQRLEDVGGGAVVLTLEVAGLVEVERWVLGYGAQAEVLAPEELRRTVRETLAAGARRYERLPPIPVSRHDARLPASRASGERSGRRR
jgi:predicted DNA-binding transcriptional regulator YafY